MCVQFAVPRKSFLNAPAYQFCLKIQFYSLNVCILTQFRCASWLGFRQLHTHPPFYNLSWVNQIKWNSDERKNEPIHSRAAKKHSFSFLGYIDRISRWLRAIACIELIIYLHFVPERFSCAQWFQQQHVRPMSTKLMQRKWLHAIEWFVLMPILRSHSCRHRIKLVLINNWWLLRLFSSNDHRFNWDFWSSSVCLIECVRIFCFSYYFCLHFVVC